MPRVPKAKKADPVELAKFCNTAATGIVANFLNTQGIFTLAPKDNEDIHIHGYNPDTGALAYHHIAVNGEWINKWPSLWPVLRIPESKGYLPAAYQPVFFWVLNNEMTKAYVANGKLLQKRLLKSFRKTPGEQFYCIPLDQCIETELFPQKQENTNG